MSKKSLTNFHATAIYRLDESIISNEGYVYFRKGSIFCSTEHNIWLQWIGPDFISDGYKKESWPNPTKQGISLFRDYWKICLPTSTAPLTQMFLEAAKTKIK